jgi:hypothetical protein
MILSSILLTRQQHLLSFLFVSKTFVFVKIDPLLFSDWFNFEFEVVLFSILTNQLPTLPLVYDVVFMLYIAYFFIAYPGVPSLRMFLKGSPDGVYYSELLGFWTLLIVWHSKH